MKTILQPEAMRDLAADWRGEGLRIGFVPTMGFLHRGHVTLMERLRPEVDRLVVSVYVNPLQFGANEDLSRYPRDADGDASKCKAAGADALFMPKDLYPDGFSTSIHVHRLTEGLCGQFRPGHFEGVATVCARLFGLVGCDVAILGEKDWQQLAVVRRMVRDLALPVQILGGDLIRDDDGVALSSRNVYLSPDERVRARSLSRCLFAMRGAAAAGETSIPRLIEVGRAVMEADTVQYLEIVGADDLVPLALLDRPARALVAAYVGRTRLIDNVALNDHAPQ
jgi:pantoate--beta-alanine ligase